MKPIRPTRLLFLLLLLPALPLRADKTLRGKLRTAASTGKSGQADATTVGFDTIAAPAPEKVKLSGYDKPLNSRQESLFVTNSLDGDIIGLKITLTYTDLHGRTLHQSSRSVRADIPAGATRRIQFPSWDSQNSFYYRRSRRPRTANVTPYDVSCQVDTCITLNPQPTSAPTSPTSNTELKK